MLHWFLSDCLLLYFQFQFFFSQRPVSFCSEAGGNEKKSQWHLCSLLFEASQWTDMEERRYAMASDSCLTECDQPSEKARRLLLETISWFYFSASAFLWNGCLYSCGEPRELQLRCQSLSHCYESICCRPTLRERARCIANVRAMFLRLAPNLTVSHRLVESPHE